MIFIFLGKKIIKIIYLQKFSSLKKKLIVLWYCVLLELQQKFFEAKDHPEGVCLKLEFKLI